MPLSIGIVGLPNVGKSTLFQAITKKQVARENYPFCTIDPNIGVVAVPDKRVDQLAELSHSAKKIYSTVQFVDIAGLVQGAHKGEGLGNQFLAHIREVNAIVYVLRAFRTKNIVNTNQTIDILRDKEILDVEMILKDLEIVEKRLQSLERAAKSGKPEGKEEEEVLKKAKQYLEEGKMLLNQNWDDEEQKILRLYQFLTLKPRIYLLNGQPEEVPASAFSYFQEKGDIFLIMNLLNEFEISELTPEEKKELGLPLEAEINSLIQKSYQLLDLITFLTTGTDETRAWTLKKGSRSPQAGGVIHSDFEKYFIKAEVINWKTLLEAGGLSKAREQGLLRTEGKDYVVQDGDVIEIKSGV